MEDLRIYLNDVSHVDAWVSGGKIPLNPASAYRSDDRKGVMTPDENHILDLGGMPNRPFDRRNGQSAPFVIGGPDVSFRNVVTIGWGPPTMLNGVANYHFEDGMILCLSRGEVQEWRAHNKKACVRINCLERLVNVLSKQMSARCRHAPVTYTEGVEREHFKKSHLDSWQKEYRLFWLVEKPKPIWVDLPPEIASRCEM